MAAGAPSCPDAFVAGLQRMTTYIIWLVFFFGPPSQTLHRVRNVRFSH